MRLRLLVAVTLAAFLAPAVRMAAYTHKEAFSQDGVTLTYSISNVEGKLVPYDPKVHEIPTWVNIDRKAMDNWFKLYGKVLPGQTITVSVKGESGWKRWKRTPNGKQWSSSGRLSSQVMIDYYKSLMGPDESFEASSGTIEQTFTISEAAKFVSIKIACSFTESLSDDNADSQASHSVRAILVLEVDHSRDGLPVQEETTIAPPDAGEDAGSKFPWFFVLVGVAGTGVGLVASRKKKKEKERDREREEAHSTFRMILYKDFGDALTMGDPPRRVGARIEETRASGERVQRPDLTALIVVEAEENCEAGNSYSFGKYRVADVSARDYPDGTVPETAKVRIIFRGPGGTMINHVIFRVEEAPEIVIGEALTFAACGGKTLEMQFGINNFPGRVAGMQAQISEQAAAYFTVAQPVADREVPGKYIISITERGTTRKEAGAIEQYFCNLTVYLEGREEPLRASFSVFRLHLGLRLEMRALKGYLVRFDSSWGSEIPTMDPKIRKKYGESKVTFKLIVEDEENGVAASVIPDTEPVFTFEDMPEESLLFVDKYGNRIQDPCKLMQFKYTCMGCYDDNTVWGVIYSTAGGLLPPNRAKARVRLSVTWHGQTFEDSIEVPIISQPFVDITDNQEYSRWLNENQRRYEKLIELKNKIEFNPLFAELSPFYYKVYAMVEGYHPDFGIYEPDYEKIMRVYEKLVSGQIGNAFANETAWYTGISQADENFNAFLATFGSIERSWAGIGMRIALAYFTAGASELVFTPYSALVKMQERVNKGEDSALKCFAMASGEVIFWEGVFYVGGKALPYVKDKVVQFGENTGINDKLRTLKDKTVQYVSESKLGSRLKQAFEELKEGYKQLKESREATKKLARDPGYNTSELGDKVKKGAEKVTRTKANARAKANNAIRQTRQKGDAVFSRDSHIAEESAKIARKDAQKIVDHFTEVMNNPTATEAEIRRATLALQGNKHAQNILRNSPSDMLRANYNANMQRFYDEVDPICIKKLAKRLGVPESEIQPWKGASGNNPLELRLGRKIAADRDVTFQVRDKNGNWIDIQEDIMEECYAEAFNEKHFNFLPADRQECLKTLKQYDQAVVNGETGLESYGKDLERIIDPARQTEKLLHPERVANTFKHKCKEFLSRGQYCHEQAAQLEALGMYDEAMRVRGFGESLVEEGIRQNTKQFKRILDPRIQASSVKGLNKDYSELYEKISILESLGNPPPKDALPITLEEARVVLQDQYGTTIEAVVEECANIISEVNEYL